MNAPKSSTNDLSAGTVGPATARTVSLRSRACCRFGGHRHSELAQQRPQGLVRRQRCLAQAVALQIDEKCTVRKPVGEQLPGLDSE